ncbi:MAG: 2-amino-4-hydroxy-6-hydroxymethyldihydropteridine diphosphokinase [Terrimicrobiaceae bacterium]
MLRRAVVAVGSNVGDRGEHLAKAFEFLRSLHEGPADECLISPVLETEPVDCPPGSPVFLNAVASFLSSLQPLDLLDRLLAFEQTNGRPPVHERNAPRTLDLDLLLLGDLEWRDDRLTLPHPRWMQRAFVLEPLAEILPHLRPPGSALTIVQARDALRRLP